MANIGLLPSPNMMGAGFTGGSSGVNFNPAFAGSGIGGFPVNGNSAFNTFSQPLASLPTGLAGSGCACFSSGSNPGFGGQINDNNLQMMQMMMQMMLMVLGTQLGGDQGQSAGNSASDSGASSVGGGDAGSQSFGGANPSSSPSGKTDGVGGSAPSNNTKDKGEITAFIEKAASVYGANPKVLTEVARRESNFQTGAVNDWDSNAKKGTPSKGLFQFIEPTFKSYAAKAKKANPSAWQGLGELNWLDWRQQALAASWAIANGHGSAWSTYKAAGGK